MSEKNLLLRHRGFLLALALVAVTAVAYAQVWSAGFIWDDDAHLTENPCIVGPLGFAGIWTTSAATYYPLVLTSFWVQHALWGLNPLGYHVVNVLVHGACAVLLWMVLRRLRVRGAWLGAALWALHPVQVESVAWITELKNTQSCLFYLVAILFFLKWLEPGMTAHGKGRWGSYALAFLAAILAILSKSSTVMLPVILGLCWWWQERRWRWRNLWALAPFFLISALASAWTIWEQKFHSGALGEEWSESGAERVVIAGRAIWFYLGKLAWPHPLIFIYPRWVIDAAQPWAYLPALAAVGGLLLLWGKRNSWGRPLFFAAAYFAVSLFPVLNFFSVFFFRYSFVGDHFQYLASIGPIALAAAGIVTLFDRAPSRMRFLQPAVGAGLVVLLGVLTWRQTPMYANQETLWRTTIERNPGAWMASANLANLLLYTTHVDEGIAHCERALKLNPKYPEGLNTLGNLYYRKGRVEDAIVQFRKGLDIRPNFPEAWNNLGSVLVQAGRLEEAIRSLREAVAAQPDYAEAWSNLGAALLRVGQTDESIASYARAAQLRSGAGSHINLGLALMQAGRVDEAIEHYSKALALDPGRTEGWNNRGIAAAKKGDWNAAIADYARALEIRPAYAEARNNLGIALAETGRVDAAIEQYSSALQINPAYGEAHNNLANVLVGKGRIREAIEHWGRALEIEPSNVSAEANLAWVLATCPDASLRDGARALGLARRAAEQTAGADPNVLLALAAANAETGQFDEAASVASRALELVAARGNEGLAGAIRNQLEMFRAKRPFRDPQLGKEAASPP